MEKKELTPIQAFLLYAEESVNSGKLSMDEYNELKENIENKLITSPPQIAIIGKAGVGKSTTINKLFDVDDFVVDVINLDNPEGDNRLNKTSDIDTGSFFAIRKRFTLKSGSRLDIIDMPGLGDDIEKDIEHEKVYKAILPECDVVLYVLDSVDRSYSEDEHILKDIVMPSCPDMGKKLVIAMNKVDVIGKKEHLQWDIRINRPSRRQEELILTKQKDLQNRFSILTGIEKEKILCYSALKLYNLLYLMNEIIKITPFVESDGIEDFTVLMPKKYQDLWNSIKDVELKK